jgi:hypothetical protein
MKAISFLVAGALVFVLGSAQAALIDRGSGLIYDDDLNITWLQNWGLGGSQLDWNGAMSWVANLDYYDTVRKVTYTDWRLPHTNSSCSYDGCANTELGHLRYTELGGTAGNSLAARHNANYELFNDPTAQYWSDLQILGNVYYMDFYSGRQDTHPLSANAYAWAVRDGDVSAASIAAVPEPETFAMLLEGLGLLGFMARCRKNLAA